MARSIQSIFDEIISLKEQQSELSGLSSTSNTAIYRLLIYIVAVTTHYHESLWDLFRQDLDNIKATSPVMSEKWWIDKLLNLYQYDNTDTDKGVLTIDDDFIPKYVTTDATKRIIKFAAVKQSTNSRQVNIKIAKADFFGNPEQLSNDELQSAKSFVNSLQAAGLFLNVISFTPDKLKLNLDIYFDGQYVQSNVLNNVKTAIRTYLQNLKFDGTIELTKLVDALQLVSGVKDIYINSAEGLSEGQGYAPFLRVYNAIAGYAELDDTNSVFNFFVEK